MALENVTKALEDLEPSLRGQEPLSDAERNAFYAAYERVRATIETPIDAGVRILFGGYDATVLEIAMDLGLLNQLAAAQGQPKSVADLAAPAGADSVLVHRVLRVLCASNLAKEVAEGQYVAVALTPAFSDASPLSKSALHIITASQALVKTPAYFRETKWQNPKDSFDGPFQYGMATKLQYFDWLKQDPKQQEAFNTHMTIQRMERGPNWFEFYPVQERLLKTNSDKSKPFLVDLGGGVGHDLAAFSEKFPELTLQLIIEDLAHVLAEIDQQPHKLASEIQRIPHDLFDPQPVIGARVYYLRTVLHDWPDKQAKLILGHIRDAMDPESVLLLNENALPNEQASGFQSRVDWLMLSILSGIDRTEKQFRQLLDECGFEVRGTYKPTVAAPGAGTVFEAARME